jgi:hypothetical protein
MSEPKQLVPLSALMGTVARVSFRQRAGGLQLSSLLGSLNGRRASVCVAATVNVILLGYILRSWIRSGRLAWECQTRLRGFVERVWNVAVQVGAARMAKQRLSRVLLQAQTSRFSH